VQHLGGTPGNDAGGIEVLYAHQPATAGMTRIEVTADRCNQGAQVQRAGRGRRKTAYIIR
jgi:hypothetical protein